MTHTVLLWNQRSRDKARLLVDAAPDGYIVTVKAPQRTLEQNSKFWAMLTDLSIQKPEGRTMTPNLWKAAILSACGHEVQFCQGIDGGPPFPVQASSSRLSKYQMMDVIEWMLSYGARHGVIWSDEAHRPAPDQSAQEQDPDQDPVK